MSLLHLRLDVKGTAIMREVAVPEEFTLAFLHTAIQSAFGWLDYHLHEFTDAKGMRYEDRDCEPPDDDEPYAFEDEVPMKRLFKKPGDTLDYEYDFGDRNEVKITLLGRVKEARREHFASRGTDMVEDSAALGGTDGVVKILRGKSRKQKEETIAWLAGAFRKCPEAVLHEPDALEIFLRIYRLVHLVGVAEGYARDSYPHEAYLPCMENMHTWNDKARSEC